MAAGVGHNLDPTGRVVARALADPTFRQALIADPRSAILQELGGTLPEGLEIHVVEETPTKAFLVLPALAAQSDGDELTEADLSRVAGGMGFEGGNIMKAPPIKNRFDFLG